MDDVQMIDTASAELERLAETDGTFGGAGGQARHLRVPLGQQLREAGRLLRGTPRRARELIHLAGAQNRLIFPGQWTQGHPRAEYVTPAGAERLTLSGSRGERIAALFAPALTRDGRPRPDAARRPTLLFFYGNDMYLASSVHIAERIRRMGTNVLVPEYLGFGLSEGKPCEAACYDTADAVWRHVMRRKDVDKTKIVASGASLGGAVAIDLAARAPVAGLVTLVTFTSIPDVARHTHPHVPIWWFIKHRFESVRKMPRVICPMVIGHSTGDRLIPYEMADRLAAAAGGPVERFKIEGANHKSTEMLEVGGDVIFKTIDRFLGRVADRGRDDKVNG
jgi:alpha-beta hydrolase superfamily lysophospholipase